MVAQLSFNFKDLINSVEVPKISRSKKRVRYLVPTYIKFYSLYQYDRYKFTLLMKEWLNTAEGQNRTYKDLQKKQKEILDQCYIRDEQGMKLRDSDEKHIYRIKTLHKIYEQINNYIAGYIFCSNNTGSFYYDNRGFYYNEYLKVFVDDNEAMLNIDDNGMSIKERVIIHLRLLRGLRKGLSIKEAVCQLNG